MLIQTKARKADTVPASPHGSPRWCLVVVAFILVGREQPRSLARPGHVEQDQPPVLRFCRRNARGALCIDAWATTSDAWVNRGFAALPAPSSQA
jgi:hypothetical protein